MESALMPSSLHRVLLVEDDPIIQRVHKTYLLKMGYEVDVVADGKHAIAMHFSDYSLVVLDFNLPQLDGLAVAKHIRQQELLEKRLPMPIILLSAYPQEQLLAASLQIDIDIFATKPIAYEKLESILSEQLRKVFTRTQFFDFYDRSY